MTRLTPATVAAISFASPAITARNVSHLHGYIPATVVQPEKFSICHLFLFFKKKDFRDVLGIPVVETLLSNAGSSGSIPGQGAKIPYASWPKAQNIKQKQYCNKLNKDFKNRPHPKNEKILKKNPPKSISS